MTPQIALTLGILLAAIILFASERLRVDVIALIILVVLSLTGLVGLDELFAGFSNPAVITVWAVYIVSGGLFKTGVAALIGRLILRVGGSSEPRLIAVIMATCGVMSAFMNNVGATAVLMPAMVAVSRQAKVPLSRLLIPLAFSSLMGGNTTLIGTPANILASNILADRGLATFSLFDFVPTGLLVFSTGIIYMVVFGRRLLPVREPTEMRPTSRLRQYVSEVRVPADSPLAGKTLLEARLGADYDVTVLLIEQGAYKVDAPQRDSRIHADDWLLVEGTVDDLLRAQAELGLRIEHDSELSVDNLDGDESTLVEATLAPRSQIVGRTLREARFRDRFGFTALAIWRQGELIARQLRDLRLRFGDTLLLQGARSRLPILHIDDDFLVLEPVMIEAPRRARAPYAIGVVLLVLVLILGLGMHVSLAMVIGSLLMVLTRCLTMEEAYDGVDWRTVFLVAGMLPLGTAMETTGTARYLADQLLASVGSLGPRATLAAIYLLSALITQAMSNAAAVVLMVPIAVDTAQSIGASHLPFVLATVIGASTSFLTPMGHKANILVFGPGGYRFFDYTRVGAPLTVITLIVTLIALPILWPLF